jgi:hypothetical protein
MPGTKSKYGWHTIEGRLTYVPVPSPHKGEFKTLVQISENLSPALRRLVRELPEDKFLIEETELGKKQRLRVVNWHCPEPYNCRSEDSVRQIVKLLRNQKG